MQSVGVRLHGGRSKRQLLTLHPVREQRWLPVLQSLFPFCSVGDPTAHGVYPPRLRWTFTPQVTQSRSPSQTQPERCSLDDSGSRHADYHYWPSQVVKNLVGFILQTIKSRLRKGGSQSYIVLSPPVQAPLSPSPDGLGGSRVSCAFPHRLHAAQV